MSRSNGSAKLCVLIQRTYEGLDGGLVFTTHYAQQSSKYVYFVKGKMISFVTTNSAPINNHRRSVQLQIGKYTILHK